ncbi:5-formyltetrahydrofolate cyclo-ligase [Galbibacter sp. PAP.153]|uniref:5-formyltetrahydrofolate cyclo-ligase n=1 Tax=Galbibacter sp. PAP.153 TaxID=3104623 RepID=UPI00300BDE55
MNKKELRQLYKEKRFALTKSEIENLSIQIANQLLSLKIWDQIFYHIFLAIEKHKEIDTSFILSILQGKDKEVVIPKSNFLNSTLTNYLLTDNTKIIINEYGIPEPENGIEIASEKIDVVFIPLLAFDKKGNRIGYGKGFYDRFLATCRKDVIKIGLSFFPPEEAFNDLHHQDIALDICATPDAIYEF